ncbi:MAG: hypothetical protein A2413_04505 [Treponema sp. RIFOXYC1_FULL_61_9]|nr:MAG: hypothetical protein A2413_04505 [Treponema sp. RIFOXYC1_FULL_61_9]
MNKLNMGLDLMLDRPAIGEKQPQNLPRGQVLQMMKIIRILIRVYDRIFFITQITSLSFFGDIVPAISVAGSSSRRDSYGCRPKLRPKNRSSGRSVRAEPLLALPGQVYP